MNKYLTLSNTSLVKRKGPKSGGFQVHVGSRMQTDSSLVLLPARSKSIKFERLHIMDFSKDSWKISRESKFLLECINNLITARKCLLASEVNHMTEIVVNNIKGLAAILDPAKEIQLPEDYQIQLLSKISDLRSTLEESSLEHRMIDEIVQGRLRALRETSSLKLAQMNVSFDVSDQLCKIPS